MVEFQEYNVLAMLTSLHQYSHIPSCAPPLSVLPWQVHWKDRTLYFFDCIFFSVVEFVVGIILPVYQMLPIPVPFVFFLSPFLFLFRFLPFSVSLPILWGQEWYNYPYLKISFSYPFSTFFILHYMVYVLCCKFYV